MEARKILSRTIFFSWIRLASSAPLVLGRFLVLDKENDAGIFGKLKNPMRANGNSASYETGLAALHEQLRRARGHIAAQVAHRS
jgi:hypothetical protein